MAKFKFDIDKIMERISFVNEYNYYTPKKRFIDEADDESSQEDQPEEDNESGDELGGNEDQQISADELGLGDLESSDLDSSPDNTPDGDMNITSDDELSSGLGADMGDMGADEMGGDEVEVDVTDIVDSVEQNSQNIDDVNQKLDSITSQFQSLTDKMLQMSQTMTKNLDNMQSNIEKEFRKRNPTPNEKIQMQSLNSFPYNQKLTDFWQPMDSTAAKAEIDSAYGNKQYSIKNQKSKGDEQPKEYTITQRDIDTPLSDYFVRDSF